MSSYLNKVEQGFEKGGGGHGNQVLLAKDGNTNDNLKHTELDLATSTHQLHKLLGNKGAPKSSQASRCLSYRSISFFTLYLQNN